MKLPLPDIADAFVISVLAFGFFFGIVVILGTLLHVLVSCGKPVEPPPVAPTATVEPTHAPKPAKTSKPGKEKGDE